MKHLAPCRSSILDNGHFILTIYLRSTVLTIDFALLESIKILALELGIFFLPVSPTDSMALLSGLVFQTGAENNMVSL